MAEFTGDALQIMSFLLDTDKKIIWDLSIHKEKRSLNSNNYYWQ